ncbi:MAG TPA: ABC transporter permease subunit [Cryptosporangiaceae bacterium]|nr:ABC transporter permease subunit [Cryptosporangiaceae bacterium]
MSERSEVTSQHGTERSEAAVSERIREGSADGRAPGVGGAPGYRPGRTLSFRAEFGRQLTRRRTQLALGFLVVLPLILVGAFLIGVPDDPDTATRGTSLADVATASAANFTLFTLFVSAGFLLVVVVALFCGDTVASEASWGSLRYLLAIPVPRARLLRQKFLVGLAYSGFALVLLPTVSMIAGTLAFGWGPLQTQIGEQIPAGEALLRIALVVGFIGVTMLTVASLAFLLSVLTDAPLGAVGGAVLLWILSNILEAVEALGDLRAVLPTQYATGWLSLLSSPVQTEDMVKGAISAVAYSTVFLSIAFWRFTRKDVVS